MGLIKFFGLKEEHQNRPKRLLIWHDINKIPEYHKNIILFFMNPKTAYEDKYSIKQL